jgi:hypothetical protein
VFSHKSFKRASFAPQSWAPIEIPVLPPIGSYMFEPGGVEGRIARRAPQSDTFVPADEHLLRLMGEDEILLTLIAQAVTTGTLNQWHRLQN